MKKIYCFLSVILLSVTNLFSQGEGQAYITNSYGSDDYVKNVVPNQRTIAGGSVINFMHNDEEWTDCPEGIAAFQLACQIWEEKLYTAFPLLIKIERKPLRGANAALVKTSINGSIRSGADIGPCRMSNALKKRKMFLRETAWDEDYDVNQPDGIIVFNSNAEFYYSLDNQDVDKYYFVTTALREIAKILGFYSEATVFNNVFSFSPNQYEGGAESPYCNYFLRSQTNFNYNEPYLWATSENVWTYYHCNDVSFAVEKKLYAPPVFQEGVSLCYFDISKSDNSTLLMQPFQDKGASVRYVSPEIMGVLNEGVRWTRAIAVGMFDPIPEGTGDPDVIRFNSSEIRTTPNTQSVSAKRTTVFETNGSLLNMDLNAYFNQFETYPEPVNGRLYGGTISILRKDGTWDMILDNRVSLPLGSAPFPVFNYGLINGNNAKNYSRTPDGHLRLKITYVAEGWNGPIYKCTYKALEYLPDEPHANLYAVKPILTQRAYSDDDYYMDIKIGLNNIAGVTRVLVEQLDEGSIYPMLYYVDNPELGYFIANVDKEYKTFFKLTYFNQCGNTVGESQVLDPIIAVVSELVISISNETISLDFVTKKGRKVDNVKIKSYRIYNIANVGQGQIGNGANISNNEIGISTLPQDVYGVNVVDENNKEYRAKFVKR